MVPSQVGGITVFILLIIVMAQSLLLCLVGPHAENYIFHFYIKPDRRRECILNGSIAHLILNIPFFTELWMEPSTEMDTFVFCKVWQNSGFCNSFYKWGGEWMSLGTHLGNWKTVITGTFFTTDGAVLALFSFRRFCLDTSEIWWGTVNQA